MLLELLQLVLLDDSMGEHQLRQGLQRHINPGEYLPDHPLRPLVLPPNQQLPRFLQSLQALVLQPGCLQEPRIQRFLQRPHESRESRLIRVPTKGINKLPVGDQNNSGHRFYLELGGNLRELVDVDLDQSPGPVLRGLLLEKGGELFAGAAPIGVEVEHDGVGGLLDQGAPLLDRGELVDLLHGGLVEGLGVLF